MQQEIRDDCDDQREVDDVGKANEVVPSRYVDDYEFIRRASLDIIGRIPMARFGTPDDIAVALALPATVESNPPAAKLVMSHYGLAPVS